MRTRCALAATRAAVYSVLREGARTTIDGRPRDEVEDGPGSVLHGFEITFHSYATPTHGLSIDYLMYALYHGAAFCLSDDDARVRRALCA